MKRIAFVSLSLIIFSATVFTSSCSNKKQEPPLTVSKITSLAPFSVNYTKPTDSLIAMGNYSYVCHRMIGKNFPHEKTAGSDTLNGVLVSFNKNAPMDSVSKWAKDSASLRPATIKELATLGAEKYKTREEQMIMALGSRELIGGDFYSPVLDLTDRSFISNCWGGGKWDDEKNISYLFIRKN